MGHLLYTVNTTYVVKSVDRWREASVKAEYLSERVSTGVNCPVCSDAHILVKFSRCHRDDAGMSLQSHIDDEKGGEVPIPSMVASRQTTTRVQRCYGGSRPHTMNEQNLPMLGHNMEAEGSRQSE